MIDLRTPSDSHPQNLALIYHFAVRKSDSNCRANIGTLTVVVKRFFKVHPRSALSFKHFHPGRGDGNLLAQNAAAGGSLAGGLQNRETMRSCQRFLGAASPTACWLSLSTTNPQEDWHIPLRQSRIRMTIPCYVILSDAPKGRAKDLISRMNQILRPRGTQSDSRPYVTLNGVKGLNRPFDQILRSLRSLRMTNIFGFFAALLMTLVSSIVLRQLNCRSGPSPTVQLSDNFGGGQV